MFKNRLELNLFVSDHNKKLDVALLLVNKPVVQPYNCVCVLNLYLHLSTYYEINRLLFYFKN